MENKAFLTSTIQYQKSASDNAFALLSLFQSNSRDLLKKTLNECSWLPDYGKESCLSWNDNCQKTTENIKAFIDKGYEEAEIFLAPSTKKEEVKVKTQAPPRAKPKAKPQVKPKAKPQVKSKAKPKPKTQAKSKTASSPVKKDVPVQKKEPTTSKTSEETPKQIASAKPPETKSTQPAKPKSSSTSDNAKASPAGKKDSPTTP